MQASDSPVVLPAAEQCHYRPLEVPVPALSGDRVQNFNCVVVEKGKQAGLDTCVTHPSYWSLSDRISLVKEVLEYTEWINVC